MKLSDTLRKDHRAIRLMADILENMCTKLESGAGVEPDDLNAIVEFIRFFVRPHLTLGENFAFSVVEETGISNEGGAMLVMMTERSKLLEHGRDLRDAVTRYRQGDRGAAQKIIQSARAYLPVLRHETEIEEQDIYPRFDAHQSVEQQRELEIRLERSETYEKYDALQKLTEMKGRYLSNNR